MEWRAVPGFPEYAASSDGDIQRTWPDKRNHKITQRPLKHSLTVSGYHQVGLSRNGKGVSARVNRIICETFHGPPPTARHHAAHNDGVKSNNAASNLRWATGKENEADKDKHGTARKGDRHWSKSMPERRAKGKGHGRSKLTDDCVRAIRASTDKQRDLAAKYGVSQKAIFMVKHFITWRHVV